MFVILLTAHFKFRNRSTCSKGPMKRAGKVCGDSKDLKSPGLDVVKYPTLLKKLNRQHKSKARASKYRMLVHTGRLTSVGRILSNRLLFMNNMLINKFPHCFQEIFVGDKAVMEGGQSRHRGISLSSL